MGGYDPSIPADEWPCQSCVRGTAGRRSRRAFTVHRRSADRSLNAVRHRARILRNITMSIRALCALSLAGLSLSNAPAQDFAGPQPASDSLRIALADVQAISASTPDGSRFVNGLTRCRSSLDGSFSELVDAARGAFGSREFSHIVTDVTASQGSSASVAMIFRTRGPRGMPVVREARATIDLATCAASDISVVSA